jgi:hypothetical protein
VVERIAVWLLSLPLLVGGSAVAHWAAYRLVYPAGGERAEVLAESGHGYLTHAPQAIAVAAAVAAVAFAVRALTARCRPGCRRPGLRLLPFAALPLIAFVLQEHLERLLHDGVMPLDAALQPTFAVGLALQVPFGLVAFGLARLLLQIAERVMRTARPAPPRRRLAPAPVTIPSSLLLAPRAGVLARARGLRGPPLAVGPRS